MRKRRIALSLSIVAVLAAAVLAVATAKPAQAHPSYGQPCNCHPVGPPPPPPPSPPPSATDTTPPTTAASGVPVDWGNAPVAVSLRASDNSGGSGVKQTEYKLGDGAWTTYASPFTVSADGETLVTYRATDNAGNVEAAKKATVRIDSAAPTTAATGVPSGWSGGDVTVTLVATDTRSGVQQTEYKVGDDAWATYTVPFVVSTEGATTVSYRASDKAGNVEAAKSLTVKIDKVGPTTTASNTLSVKRNKKATFRFSLTDRTATGTVTIKIFKGAKLSKSLSVGAKPCGRPHSHVWKQCTLAKGTYTWKVYAIDEAGNAQVEAGSGRLVVK